MKRAIISTGLLLAFGLGAWMAAPSFHLGRLGDMENMARLQSCAMVRDRISLCAVTDHGVTQQVVQ
jgi:hypothetical protein